MRKDGQNAKWYIRKLFLPNLTDKNLEFDTSSGTVQETGNLIY